MIRLLRSELLKARTTRTALGLALGLGAIVGGIAGIASGTMDKPPPFAEAFDRSTRDAISSLGFVPLFALLFGLLSSTSEYRHGTISPSLLMTPARALVVAAKVVSSALVGLALGVVAVVLALAVAMPVLALRGFEIDGGEAARVVVGILAAAALWGALGAGVGAIVTNQVAAIVGSLAWVLVVESILSGLLPRVDRYLPFGALGSFIGLDHGSGSLSAPAGIAVTLAYVAAAGVLGALRTRARDVS